MVLGGLEAHLAVHLEVQLDESLRARQSGPQVVQVEHFRVAAHDGLDALPLLGAHLPVHQHVQGTACDQPSVPEDIDSDGQAEQGVGQGPAQLRHQQHGDDDRPVNQEVAQVVQGIGLDGD